MASTSPLFIKGAEIRSIFVGARSIMACRDVQKAQVVQEEVVQLTGNTKIVIKCLDLACQQSVREFAADFNQSKLALVGHHTHLVSSKGLHFLIPEKKNKF